MSREAPVGFSPYRAWEAGEVNWFEIVGYAGSVLVAISLTMRSVWRLRWFNLLGAVTLVAYGLLIEAAPVALLNGFIAVVNAYYLYDLARRRDSFSFLEVPVDSPYLREFLRFYRDDIARYFPSFDLDRCNRPQVRLILRNMLPVGVFVCEPDAGGVASICLDYVVPGYRDLKNAHFAFAAAREGLRKAGLHTFAAVSEVRDHQRYLRRLGFTPDPAVPERFTRPV
jgi:hypothetical protein